MDKPLQQHWKRERDEDQIEWLTFDRQGANTNSLHQEALQELLEILQSFQDENKPRGLVIQSGKKTGFIAGADIEQFKNLKVTDSALNLIKQGQLVFNYLADLNLPTIALIEGFCLGGGLELALACRYRIVIEDPKTVLGLPEVKLGIHPGWGGTVRLPRLIGPIKAMDLILTGRVLKAKQAYRMGIADACIPKRSVKDAVHYYINKQPEARKAGKVDRLLDMAFVRQLLGKVFQKKLSAKISPTHYPAPYAALNNWVKHGIYNESAFITEAKSVSQLALTSTAHNLIRVFYLREQLKSLGKEVQFRPKHIHVIGAGVMGGDIASWCALRGFHVTLQDPNERAIASAFGRAHKLYEKKLRETHLVKAARDRLVPDPKGQGIAHADLIIEAIIEKLEAKQELLKSLELKAKPEAIFATNTSTIPLEKMCEVLQNKGRLVGLHFFNPVPMMPLVEVVKGENTDEDTFKKAMACVHAFDKLPLPVKSSPGFLVNRILLPYLVESVLLLESGVSAAAIDKTAEDFGLPMGPIELADTVGLDVCLYCTESLNEYFGGSVPKTLEQLVKEGHLGRKSGQGFYQYKKGKPIKPKLTSSNDCPKDVIDRLLLSMLNRAVACLREEVVASPDLLDAGMIFGTGFPPFRGGPMHYALEQGESLLVKRLNELTERYGERFSPDEGWARLESNN